MPSNGHNNLNRSKLSRHVPRRKVAVAVTLSNRKELTPEEQISLRHVVHYLGRHDRYVVAPKSLEVDYPGFGVKRFNDNCFGSVAAHTRLMLSSEFYKAFSDYEFILIYHLDALVFSDQLLEWCEKDWDYIGAPWLVCDDMPHIREPRVGNGGFSLRKVESFLKVIYSSNYFVDPDQYWQSYCARTPRMVQVLNTPRKYLKRLTLFNDCRWHIQWALRGGVHEDRFWADNARHYYPKFKIAPVEEGLRFAFEGAPRMCFELNNHQLPFGCHRWNKFDREFWEPYLLK